MDKAAAKFFMTLLNAGTQAHILHFQASSGFQHLTLGEFYEAITDKADSLIEAYQGKYGIVKSYPSGFDVTKDPVKFITDLSSFVATYRDFCDDSEIQNMIDDIAGLIDGTMYKIKFLS